MNEDTGCPLSFEPSPVFTLCVDTPALCPAVSLWYGPAMQNTPHTSQRQEGSPSPCPQLREEPDITICTALPVGTLFFPHASHICVPMTKTPNRSNQRKGGGASGSSHCIVIWETTFVPWEGQETRPKPDRNQDRVAFKDSPPRLLLPSRPHSFQTVS